MTHRSPFNHWLILIGLILFGFYIANDYGFLELLLHNDATYLSSIIIIIFLITSLLSGLALYQLSNSIQATQKNATTTPTHKLIAPYQQLIQNKQPEAALEWLNHQIRSPFSNHWFIADLLLKLGLIGTVIGFILMLGAITDIEHLDISEMKNLLSVMSEGMKTALFTTLSGLIGGSLLGLQNNMLDNAADTLASNIIELTTIDH